jgi:hypothetical protein
MNRRMLVLLAKKFLLLVGFLAISYGIGYTQNYKVCNTGFQPPCGIWNVADCFSAPSSLCPTSECGNPSQLFCCIRERVWCEGNPFVHYYTEDCGGVCT